MGRGCRSEHLGTFVRNENVIKRSLAEARIKEREVAARKARRLSANLATDIASPSRNTVVQQTASGADTVAPVVEQREVPDDWKDYLPKEERAELEQQEKRVADEAKRVKASALVASAAPAVLVAQANVKSHRSAPSMSRGRSGLFDGRGHDCQKPEPLNSAPLSQWGSSRR